MHEHDYLARPEGGDLATYQQHQANADENTAQINMALGSSQVVAQNSVPAQTGEGVGSRY